MLLPLQSILAKVCLPDSPQPMSSWRVVETHRLSAHPVRALVCQPFDVRLVIMEACGSAHHWARWLNGLGIDRQACYPRSMFVPTCKRNKTDATADAAALLDAARACRYRPGEREVG